MARLGDDRCDDYLANIGYFPKVLLYSPLSGIWLAIADFAGDLCGNEAYLLDAKMMKKLLFNTLFFFLFPLAVWATPRLTVVVLVDGLNTTGLNEMRQYWPEGGLRTLAEEAYQTTLRFPHLVYGGDETTASLMTGVAPSEHGVSMNHCFVRQDRKVHSLLEDSHEKGIGTYLHFSPRALLAPTITDNWRMRIGRDAKIYAVGIHPETTILLAGHAADACCWLGGVNPYDALHWVSTSFYRAGLPAEADEMNVNGRVAEISQREWKPRMDISMYNHPTDKEKRSSFSYRSQDVLLTSPAANALVVELALSIQKHQHLGEDLTPDLLMLEMTTRTPKATSDQILSAEQEDMYLSLNQEIGFLMEQLTRRVGAEHFELVVMGKPALGISHETMALAGMPVQQFSVDRAAALTATYLMAIYGHERWVDGGYGQSIFLNRTLIEQKRLSIETMQRQVANFLMEFEGVKCAYPASEIHANPQLHNSLNKRSLGDVAFSLQSGWQLVYEEQTPIDHVIDLDPEIPLLYWSRSRMAFPEGEMTIRQINKLIQ